LREALDDLQAKGEPYLIVDSFSLAKKPFAVRTLLAEHGR
jgi:hypothetical protein